MAIPLVATLTGGGQHRYNDRVNSDLTLIFPEIKDEQHPEGLQIYVRKQVLCEYCPMFLELLQWWEKDNNQITFNTNSEQVLELVQQAYGKQTQAAHTRQWDFWFGLATLGLTSERLRNAVPGALKAQARANFITVALSQSDVDIVQTIITKIAKRNDPYLNPIATRLYDRAEQLRRDAQRSESEAPAKRRKLDSSTTRLGSTLGRTEHQTITQGGRRSSPSVLSPGSSQPQGNTLDRGRALKRTITETVPRSRSTTLSPERTHVGHNADEAEALEFQVSRLQLLLASTTGTRTTTPDDTAEGPDPASQEDSLADDEHFIREIKGHQIYDLTEWRRSSKRETSWAPRGTQLGRGKTSAAKVLDSKIWFELQLEDKPEGQTVWEPEEALRCPNLKGPNLLEQYKEQHKLGVYADPQ